MEFDRTCAWCVRTREPVYAAADSEWVCALGPGDNSCRPAEEPQVLGPMQVPRVTILNLHRGLVMEDTRQA